MRVHVGVEQTQVRKLLPVVPRHLPEHRALQVNYLVVGERQHEVLVVGVQHAERELVVMALAMHGVLTHVREDVVHPSHVPLEPEAEPAVRRGSRDTRPSGRFLSDREHVRELGVDPLVEPPQEVDCLDVLLAAVLVGRPFSLFAAVVAV